MTYYRVLREGAEGEGVPRHTHDATDINGTFNFVRILKAIIDGDLTVSGFFRTTGSGNRIEIRPASAALASSLTLFTGTGSEAGLIEPELNGGELGIVGPDGGSGAAFFRLLNTGVLVLDSNNAAGFIELFKYLQMNNPVRLADGTVSLPSLTFAATGQQDVGFYRISDDVVGMTIGGVEVARFTANGLRGIEAHSDEDVGTGASFTNTTVADLDALTGTPLGSAVAVTVTTGTEAMVTVTGQLANSVGGAFTILEYRISGATTLAGDADRGAVTTSTTTATHSTTIHQTGLTAGSNTFELEARVTSGTGSLERARLTVIPL